MLGYSNLQRGYVIGMHKVCNASIPWSAAVKDYLSIYVYSTAVGIAVSHGHCIDHLGSRGSDVEYEFQRGDQVETIEIPFLLSYINDQWLGKYTCGAGAVWI
jgi:mRNA degradation ribonuclease J1/J2